MKALLIRDLRLSFRSGGGFGLALAFFLIVVVLVPLAIGPDTSQLRAVSPGILWLASLLACLLSLDRIFGLDYEDGTFDVLATSPLPLETVFISKSMAHWLTTGLPLAVLSPLFGVLLNLPDQARWVIVVSLFLGTPALSMIGAFGGSLTIGIKRGGLLLSLLVLPLYIPTLILGAEAVRRAGEGMAYGTHLSLLGAVTLLTAAILPFATAAALRVNLR